MGLLDFDDEKILKSRTMPAYVPKWRLHKKDAELEENFHALQNLGHSEQSADFSDSAFADRQCIHEKTHEEIGHDGLRIAVCDKCGEKVSEIKDAGF